MSTAWLCWSAWQSGQPLLLADEIYDQQGHLSFECEFGKIIGRLDLLSAVLTEKDRRAVITYAQILLGGTFLQSLLGRCQ